MTASKATPQPTGEVHPAADLFPLLPDDELAELAADIAANGLIYPIMLDAEGTLVDGRNRLAACRLAGVEPRFTTLNGHDPVAYILSANVARRNLSKGQRAMAVAKLVLLSNTALTRERRSELASHGGLSEAQIAFARVVIEYAPELTDRVMDGSSSLGVAYQEAQKRKAVSATLEEQAARAAAEMAELEVGAPDLASLVSEGRLPLTSALTEWRRRDQERQEQRIASTRMTAAALLQMAALMVQKPETLVNEWVEGVNRDRAVGLHLNLWTSAGLRELAASIVHFADVVERERGGELR